MTGNSVIQYELDGLQESFKRYAMLIEKKSSEVVRQKGQQLRFFIYQGLRALMPAKGSIRSSRVEALKSGQGVKVREGVLLAIQRKYGQDSFFGRRFRSVTKKGRQMNFMALAVERELNLRESARGFLSFSTPVQPSGDSGVAERVSRYQNVLSDFTMEARESVDNKFAQLRWPAGSKALGGLSKERQMSVVADAIKKTREDIDVYVNRKLKEGL